MRILASFVAALSFVLVAFVGMLPAEESDDLVFPIEVMHHDVFGELDGNDELGHITLQGESSLQPAHTVGPIEFEVDGGGGELWLWGHHVGFQYFHDNFHWDNPEGLIDMPYHSEVSGWEYNNIDPWYTGIQTETPTGELLGPGTGNFQPCVQTRDGECVQWVLESEYDAPHDDRPKAAIRVNNGDWIPLNNDNVTCAATEEGGRCIGGIYSAARFKVDGSSLDDGMNHVEFAFLGHDMLSSGYRILDMAALPSGYDGRLESSYVTGNRDVAGNNTGSGIDEITTNKVLDLQTGDVDGPANVSDGAEAWRDTLSLLDWPGGKQIWASCEACHAKDGRDLQFFQYSTESIKVRSRFHGLDEQTARDIAAYIRAQEVTTPYGYEVDLKCWSYPTLQDLFIARIAGRKAIAGREAV